MRSRKPMQRRQKHHCRCEKYSPVPHAVTVPKPPHTEEGAAASEMLRGTLVPHASLEVNPFREIFFDFFRGGVDDEMVTTPKTAGK